MPTPPNTEPPADIGHELRELNRKFSRIEGVLLRTLLRKESRAQQAKVAGVHRSTLWYREKRERLRQMADGRI
ncbi:hypothetical protein [Geminisphaera colitermitum]|uniref:hypothetical protein n=1 Tax=Geminisphaera colitermitum TaxID=1148786 RepID=UPI000158D4AB|nr:hypothetical protein [Geminisphaera colitermitum]